MATKKTPLEITRDVVQIETMNPPWRELPCAQYLGKLVQDAGVNELVVEPVSACGSRVRLARR
jgi:hypothetical protein